MAIVSDFAVVGSASSGETGHWESRPFEAGGRKTLEIDGNEVDNAYVTVVLTSPLGGSDLEVRVVINDTPLPVLMLVPRQDQRTIVVAFRASLLKPRCTDHRDW